ncbi:tRNA (N6-isopentenyl adenosine(37)-C2)-methylthiotransferase MiaB [Candidatus Dependentiae bacterium]|nr:tRNA (N6-isopentenyl adenosine(37)-C2)-methylthiotransferase MiaB [Candidatus Dependentiae bacterium]
MKKASILTYGCQMNKHDSEIIAGLLNEIGITSYNNLIENPDIIILNTCAVRQNAENRIIGRIGELKQYKEKNPDLIIGICGCVAQEYGDSLLNRINHLDFVIGPADIHNFANIITEIISKKTRVSAVKSDCRILTSKTPRKRESSTQAWVSIISGCNNYCSYCIVPYVRGKEISRNFNDIIKEIEKLLSDGYKEITLLGQNVNSYGNDLSDGSTFPKLLKKIVSIKGDYWLRFVTSHPKDLSDELIDIIAESNNICRHLHLPAQSGSTKILELMNRRYSRQHYISLIGKLKKYIDGISLTTDIIAGFPGETEADFMETFSLLEYVKFSSAFIFKYSPRKNTESANYKNSIPQKLIEERHKILLDLQIKISEQFNQFFSNKTVKVLTEDVSPKNHEYLTGRTEHNKIVIFKGNKELIGKFCKVKINSWKSWTLFGELISDQ